MDIKSLTGLLVISFAFALNSCGDSDESTGSNQKKVTRKIEVTGSAEMEFSPDEIYMIFSLSEYMKNDKKMKLDDLKTEFEGTCKKVGVKNNDVSISSYGGNERYDYWWYYRRRHEPDFMGTVSYSVKVNSTGMLDKLVAELNEDAMTNFHIERSSHSEIEKFRKKVKTDAMVASKNKAKYLAKSVGEKIGETLKIEEIENGNDQYQRNPYSSYYARNSNTMSNVSQSSYDMQGNSNGSPSFKKIKLRYEIKAVYRLK